MMARGIPAGRRVRLTDRRRQVLEEHVLDGGAGHRLARLCYEQVLPGYYANGDAVYLVEPQNVTANLWLVAHVRELRARWIGLGWMGRDDRRWLGAFASELEGKTRALARR